MSFDGYDMGWNDHYNYRNYYGSHYNFGGYATKQYSVGKYINQDQNSPIQPTTDLHKSIPLQPTNAEIINKLNNAIRLISEELYTEKEKTLSLSNDIKALRARLDQVICHLEEKNATR